MTELCWASSDVWFQPPVSEGYGNATRRTALRPLLDEMEHVIVAESRRILSG
jgi:hypothetical protein